MLAPSLPVSSSDSAEPASRTISCLGPWALGSRHSRYVTRPASALGQQSLGHTQVPLSSRGLCDRWVLEPAGRDILSAPGEVLGEFP